MKNKEYYVIAPVDYVMGHLRYGHFEGTIELSEEDLQNPEMIKQCIKDYCELIIDDYEVDGYGEIVNFELKEIENNE